MGLAREPPSKKRKRVGEGRLRISACCASWLAFLRRKKINEVIEFRRGKSGTEKRHGGFAPQFAQIAQLAFAKTVEAALLVLDLNGKSIFLEPNATNGLARIRNRFDEEKILGNRFRGILQRLAQTGRAATHPHVGEFGAVA